MVETPLKSISFVEYINVEIISFVEYIKVESISFVEYIKVEASLGQVYPIFSIKIYIANLHIFPITFGFHFAELNTIVLFSAAPAAL